jgi:hypothetical protein
MNLETYFIINKIVKESSYLSHKFRVEVNIHERLIDEKLNFKEVLPYINQD